MKIRITRTIAKYYYAIFLSLFVFGFVIRKSFFSGILGTGNFLFFGCLFIIMANSLIYHKISFNGLLGIMVLSGIVLLVDINTQSKIYSIINAFLYLIIPLLLMNTHVLDTADQKAYIKTILRILNFFVILIVIIMFLDQISNYMVTRAMANIFSYINEDMPSSFGFLRFRSRTYLGHELYNTHYILMFYCLNMLYWTVCKEQLLNARSIHVISIFGILFTQSKLGVMLLFAAIVYFNIKSRNRLINICLLMGGGAVLYYLGFFDVIIGRFQGGSFTTHRLEALDRLINSYGMSLRIFGGYGENLVGDFTSQLYSYYGSNQAKVVATAAFESPIVIMAFRYGILAASIWAYQLFICPAIKIWKTKKYKILFCYILMVLQVMSFNQLIYNPDLMCAVLIWNSVYCGLIAVQNDDSIAKTEDLYEKKEINA